MRDNNSDFSLALEDFILACKYNDSINPDVSPSEQFFWGTEYT
jgi:hypothetical protein